MTVKIDGTLGIGEIPGIDLENGVAIDDTNGDMILKTGDVEKMRLTSDGKLGIGTASPSESLDIAGSANFSGNGKFSGDVSVKGGAISPFTGMRNRIINGAMEIAQRGVSAQYNKNISGDSALSLDRMFSNVNSSDAVFTQSQETLIFEGVERKCIRQTIDTPFILGQPDGNAYLYGISQYLEGTNTHDLKGKPVTLSFIFNTNVSGRYSIYMRDADGGSERNSFVSTFDAVANTPIRVSTTTNEIPLTANIPNTVGHGMSVGVGFIGSITGVTSDTGSWVSGNKLTTSDSTNWASQEGNFIELTELQLEEGTQATPFERRPFGTELALCQRYYEVIEHGWQDTRVTEGLPNTFPFNTSIQFSTTKRATPSVSIVGLNTSFGAVVTPIIKVSGFNVGAGQNTSGGGNNSFIYIDEFIADAEL